MSCNIFLTLPGNTKLPALGLGTASANDDSLEKALDLALEIGYRHIDTAERYKNEEVIGKVLKRWFQSGKLKREEIFISTKLPLYGMHPDKVEDCLKKSLRKLQLEYVDLYLIHYPIALLGEGTATYGDPDVDYIDVWKKMEEQNDTGRAKLIGVCNFSIKKIERLLKHSRIKPAVNQIEVNVSVQRRQLVDFCTKKDITIIAHCPLGVYSGTSEHVTVIPLRIESIVLDDDVIREIAKRHTKSTCQVALRFLLQLGLATIPKSVTPARLRENFNVFDFSLDEEDMCRLRKLEVGQDATTCDFRLCGRLQEHPDFEF